MAYLIKVDVDDLLFFAAYANSFITIFTCQRFKSHTGGGCDWYYEHCLRWCDCVVCSISLWTPDGSKSPYFQSLSSWSTCWSWYLCGTWVTCKSRISHVCQIGCENISPRLPYLLTTFMSLWVKDDEIWGASRLKKKKKSPHYMTACRDERDLSHRIDKCVFYMTLMRESIRQTFCQAQFPIKPHIFVLKAMQIRS